MGRPYHAGIHIYIQRMPTQSAYNACPSSQLRTKCMRVHSQSDSDSSLRQAIANGRPDVTKDQLVEVIGCLDVGAWGMHSCLITHALQEAYKRMFEEFSQIYSSKHVTAPVPASQRVPAVAEAAASAPITAKTELETQGAAANNASLAVATSKSRILPKVVPVCQSDVSTVKTTGSRGTFICCACVCSRALLFIHANQPHSNANR